MSKQRQEDRACTHQSGCGCTPALFTDIIEQAGLQLSRREFLAGAAAISGMLAAGGLASAVFAAGREFDKDATADTIYHGGPILTMVADGDRAEALAVKDGHILAVGTMAEVMARKGDATKLVDLGGKTLLPGFIDPHSHVALQSVKFTCANLDPKPIGEVGSIADLQRVLREHIEEKQLKPGEWVIGWGYDDTGMKEQRHPNREDLDAVSTEHPIALMHISVHLMAGNSLMLKEVGITKDTKDPEGGVIQRQAGSQEPNGVLEESAMLLAMDKIPMPTPEEAAVMLEEGMRRYAQAGITTAQDCASGKGTWQLL
jgi:predicted amidohydrolase YtcJ